MKKLDGVESVEVSLEKATADVRLKPDNKITLTQLRQTIRKSGYPTRDAQIEARGAVIERNGTPLLDLQNGSILELSARPEGAGTAVVTIVGVSRVTGDREMVTPVTPK